MNKRTVDELPKEAIARKVITPKRLYFVPGKGQVEATQIEDVAKKVKAKKVGDGNN